MFGKKKIEEALREQRQDHRLNELQADLWDLEEEIRELKEAVKKLENKRK